MNEMLQDPSVPETHAVTGPGPRLAEARETQALSREQVALQLRLNLRIVEALEADDYDRLPPAAYVTGYLRAYARLLGLPEEEILDTYASRHDAPTPTIEVIAKGQPAQVQASDLPVKLMTYLIVGGLLVLLGLWWFAQRDILPDARQDSGTLDLPVPPMESAPTPQEAAPEPAAPPAAVAETTAPPPAESAVPESAPAPAVEETTVPEPVPVEKAVANEPESPAPPPLTSDIPQSRLELSFDADCWVEISDAAGRNLYFNLAHADDHLVLHGEAPFRVFLGYSPGASISFNGAPFDHTPFQRRDIARFRVGSSADNAPLTEVE